MIDTSAMVAGLVADHEHHELARPHLHDLGSVSAIVLAETFAQLRRTFRQPVTVATSALLPWSTEPGRVLDTPATAVVVVFARAVELDLGGNVHDALIAQVCIENESPLITLDRRQHTVALALGADSQYLLA